ESTPSASDLIRIFIALLGGSLPSAGRHLLVGPGVLGQDAAWTNLARHTPAIPRHWPGVRATSRERQGRGGTPDRNRTALRIVARSRDTTPARAGRGTSGTADRSPRALAPDRDGNPRSGTSTRSSAWRSRRQTAPAARPAARV